MRSRPILGGGPLMPFGVLLGMNLVVLLYPAAFDVVLPDIRREFGMSIAGAATLAAAGIPIGVFTALAVSYAADRYKRTRLAAAGAVVLAASGLITGSATTLVLLAVASMGAAAAGGLSATHQSLLADLYPPETRARTFFAYTMAGSVGLFIGPVIAGLLTDAFSWRLPFLVFAVPPIALAVLAARLREPARGHFDLLAAGADDETADVEDEPAGLGETFRTLFALRSTRRIYAAVALYGGAILGAGSLLSLFFEEIYGLNAAQRGLVSTLTEPAAIAGLFVGAGVVQRRLDRDPGSTLYLVGAAAVAVAVGAGVMAVSPNLSVAVVGNLIMRFFLAGMGPAVFALLSLAIPARMRTLGLATYQLWLLFGLVALPFIGGLADEVGLRVGILMFLPLLGAAGATVMTAARSVNADIALVRAAGLVRAEVRRRRMDGDPQILVVRGLDVAYGQTQVLYGVDLEVADGELVAILGTNGAGKSTLLGTISGLITPRGGSIVFDGSDIWGAEAARNAARGISHVPGGNSVFADLTVAENLRVAGWLRRGVGLAEDQRRALDLFPNLRERLNVVAGSLSGGEQHALGLAQAFLSRPRLLLIDELSIGLSPAVVEDLIEAVREINERGTAVVLVEQSATVALRLSERAIFIEKGAVRFDGPSRDLLQRDDLLRHVFFSGNPAAAARRGPQRTDRAQRDAVLERPTVLRVEAATKRYGGIEALRNVSLELHEGEILGIIGPNGAGKTTLFDVISGVAEADEGRVWLAGADITARLPHQRARLGLARSFQDSGLWASLTVREALSVSFARNPAVDLGAEVDEALRLFGLEASGDKFIFELSTGTGRLVELAALLSGAPTVLMLDEPSAGIAQREGEALARVLRAVQARAGCSMLVIEHDIPLVSSVADRLIALDRGQVVTEGTPEQVLGDPAVITAYLGGSPTPDLA